MNGLYISEHGPLFVLIDEPETGKLLFSKLGGACSIFCFSASDWDRELTPWPAPGLNVGRGDFPGGGEAFLGSLLEALPSVLKELPTAPDRIGLAGYSLGGLFSLWAGTKTDRFQMLASVSGSLWYDGWTAYLEAHPCLAQTVHLSLGEKEPESRNVRMRTVGDETKKTEALLRTQIRNVTFAWNNGGHFTEPIARMESAFRVLMQA